MTPHPSPAGTRQPYDTESDRPAGLAELRARAWAAVVDRDGGPVNARQLAEDARITRGAAAAFLAEWVAAGLVDRGQPPAGRYAPFTVPHTARLLAAALAAADRGWSVLPLRPNGKRPAFPDHTADRCTRADPWCRDGHRGWEPRATTDPDRIRRAWSTRPYGVGVACGPSGLLVVDLDQPKPGQEPPPAAWAMDGVTDGSDVLAVLAERAGQPFPADTYTVHTGRGGTHLYFAPAGRCPARQLGGGAGRARLAGRHPRHRRLRRRRRLHSGRTPLHGRRRPGAGAAARLARRPAHADRPACWPLPATRRGRPAAGLPRRGSGRRDRRRRRDPGRRPEPRPVRSRHVPRPAGSRRRPAGRAGHRRTRAGRRRPPASHRPRPPPPSPPGSARAPAGHADPARSPHDRRPRDPGPGRRRGARWTAYAPP